MGKFVALALEPEFCQRSSTHAGRHQIQCHVIGIGPAIGPMLLHDGLHCDELQDRTNDEREAY